MLLLRALLALLVLPAVVACIVPLALLPQDRWRLQGTFAGWPVLGIGLLVLLCVHDFYVFGKGTLAPWDPPKRLVTDGLYKFVRNPMYVGVVCIVAGWGLITGSYLLAGYAAFLVAGFHLRVVFDKSAIAFTAKYPRVCELGPKFLGLSTHSRTRSQNPFNHRIAKMQDPIACHGPSGLPGLAVARR